MNWTEDDVGHRIQMLRRRSGLSIRRLAEQAGVAAGVISCLERGKNSPSIVTLQKILVALGTDLGAFFGTQQHQQKGPFLLREHMKAISDDVRTYTMILPKRQDVKIEMFDEQWNVAKRKPPFEKLECDIAGYVLAGTIELEIKGQQAQALRPGDAFYIPTGTEHRGYAIEDKSARLITVFTPARY